MGALVEAVQRGDAAAVEALLAEDPASARDRDPQGTSAVRHAAYGRRRDLIDLLLPHAGPLDVWDAAAIGDEPRLVELVDADPALVNAQAGDGFFPLALAAFFGHPACVTALLLRGADVHQRAENAMQVQPLHAAVAGRDAEIVRTLVDAGADLDARQQAGVTPLMGAASGGSADLVRLLLDAGADTSLRDETGRTAADWATTRGHPEVAALL